MPIRDRSRRRLVRLGIIRLGHLEERQGKNGKYTFPVQDNHFLLHDAPEIEQFYHERGIDKVRELDVLLPFPDIERNFDAWYQVWAGGVLVCQGDGEYVQYATPFTCSVNAKSGRTSVRNAPGDTLVSNGTAEIAFDWNGAHFEPGEYVPCPGASQDAYPHCKACRLSALLKIMMADPELFRFGYYQIATGSTRNYDTIMGTLEMMPAERVNGYPFKLRLVEEPTTYQDENGQRKKGTKWFLQLEPDPAITRELYRRQTSRMLGQPDPVAALPEPERHVPEDGEIVYVEPTAPPPFAEPQAEYTNGSEEDEFLAEPHQWTESEAAELIGWTRNTLVITDADALKALDVAKISEYAGTPEMARERINEYVAKQAA